MKGLYVAILSMPFWLMACEGKKTTPETTDIITEDSLVAESDTVVAEEGEEIMPPKSADGLFDDFLYSFMTIRHYQKERIVFPLPVSTDEKTDTLEKKQWKFDPLYINKDMYTALFESEKQMKLEKDTGLHRVSVAWIYLEANRRKTYNFEKRSGLWQLCSIANESLAKDPNASFYQFYKAFSVDSLFQAEHIQDPLAFSTYDEENFETVEGIVDVGQWFAFRPDLPQGVITQIDYGQRFQGQTKRVLVVNGVSNSMVMTFTFKKVNGTWMLAKYEN